MPPTMLIDARPAGTVASCDEDFELDLRVIEMAAPAAAMRCDTSDNCGATCSTSACSSGSLDPS